MNVGRVCDVLLPQAVACQPSLLPQGTDQRRVCYCRCRRRRACAAATAAVRRTAPVDQSEIVARGRPATRTAQQTSIEIGRVVES